MGLGKTNPKRQMMINMMYLVLTAMLALNVSKQVLKAFELVNSGLDATNTAFTSKNNVTYDAFKKQLDMAEVKVKPFYDKAMIVKNSSADMIAKIEVMKQALLTENGKLTKNEDIYEHPDTKEDIKSASDLEIGTNFFTGPKEKGGEHGAELQNMLHGYRATMQGLIDPNDKENNLININDQDPKVTGEADFTGNKWAHYYFADVPLVADLTMLTKMQNDVRNTESNMIAYLFKKINANDYKFDNLTAIITSPSPIVLQNQEYSAKVFLGAYDSHSNPDVILNGQKLEVKDGVAEYKVRASGDGEKKIEGQIIVTAPNGEKKPYKFSSAYQVFTGSAVISADKMNVFYVGLENPVSVSCPGYPPDKIIVSQTGLASWTGSNGKFIAKPIDNITTKTATITVSVKTDKGTQQMGVKEFRVKRMPKPRIYLGTKDGGPISKVELSVQSAVFANLDNFVFEGIKFTVTKFTWTFAPKGGGRQAVVENANGQIVPGSFKALVQTARSGDKFIIDDVTAQGPNGPVKITNGSVFTIL